MIVNQPAVVHPSHQTQMRSDDDVIVDQLTSVKVLLDHVVQDPIPGQRIVILGTLAIVLVADETPGLLRWWMPSEVGEDMDLVANYVVQSLFTIQNLEYTGELIGDDGPCRVRTE